MNTPHQKGLSSNATVVVALFFTVLLQSAVSLSLSLGPLANAIPTSATSVARSLSFGVRLVFLTVVIVLWAMRRYRQFFQAVIVTNGLLTLGLIMNVVALINALFSVSTSSVSSLLIDVVLIALSNVVIFSIWYWIIDPPGIHETRRLNEPWDFLFPQRAQLLPYYDDWQPRYTDYVFLAFTTSLAFSPTDTLPLSRRAKRLMMLQAAISTVTIVVVAGTAVNLL